MLLFCYSSFFAQDCAICYHRKLNKWNNTTMLSNNKMVWCIAKTNSIEINTVWEMSRIFVFVVRGCQMHNCVVRKYVNAIFLSCSSIYQTYMYFDTHIFGFRNSASRREKYLNFDENCKIAEDCKIRLKSPSERAQCLQPQVVNCSSQKAVTSDYSILSR